MAKDLKDLSDEQLISRFRAYCEMTGSGGGCAGDGKTSEALQASGKADEAAKVLLERLAWLRRELTDAKERGSVFRNIPDPDDDF